MDVQGFVVIALTFGALALILTEKASFDAIGLGLLVGLVGCGILTLDEATRGFSNYAVLTLAGLYVVGEGLTRTGAIEFVAHAVLRGSGGKPGRMIFLTGLIAAAVSSVLNDTGVLVVFIPIVIDMASRASVPASHLLMPLSFAALLGGMCTLVGTSTNLLVSGAAVQAGVEELGMFEMTPVAAPMALLGITFMAIFAPRLLPKRTSLSTQMAEASPREYVTELAIGPTSPLVGRPYANAFDKADVKLLFFVRDEAMRYAPYDEALTIAPGDVVMLRANVEDLAELQSQLGLRMIHDLKIAQHELRFFELAVSPRSSVVGHRVGDLRLHRDYGVTTVAVLRSGHHIGERASELALRPGDLLLVCGNQSVETRLQASTDFFLIQTSQPRPMLRTHARRALAIALGVVALFALKGLAKFPIFPEGWHPDKLVPIPMAALGGAVAMVATGCMTARRAYRAIDWPILIFVVGMLALGEAMASTGVAGMAANGIVGTIAHLGPVAVVSALLLTCILFNALVSHSAVAVLLTPIAIATARAMAESEGLTAGSAEADAMMRAFILAIAFGGSICFATPIGHQTNLMVYGPGGYRYTDFVRLGLPLSILAWIVASIGIPILTGL